MVAIAQTYDRVGVDDGGHRLTLTKLKTEKHCTNLKNSLKLNIQFRFSSSDAHMVVCNRQRVHQEVDQERVLDVPHHR